MRFLISKVNYFILSCLLLAVSSAVFLSCQKELSGDGILPSVKLADLTTKCNSSVSGFVTDENDVAVNGALVKVGTATTTTDKSGYFEVSNVQVIQNAALITVIQPGYFKGIKTYLATESKGAFVRIKLIPKTNVGSIDAATGGTVTLNGMSIILPASAVINAGTNAVYTGAVSVAAQWLNPTVNDLERKMPGDLRGIDSIGELKKLTTYGMAAVELTGENGELLQIAPGKKATLKINIPASILGAAPANLPLWYFDENIGLWRQEGFAVKTGSQYIGGVGHFSFWNCDVPANYIKFSGNFVDQGGRPVQNALVKISVSTDLQNGRSGYTDSTGFVSGAIPLNSQLVLQVFSDYGCSSSVYSQNITTGTSDINLSNIVIPAGKLATVTGTVVNCSNAAVSNGSVILVKDGFSFRYELNGAGRFSFNVTLCNSSSNVTLIAQDASASQEGTSIVTLSTGNNALGTLTACGVSTEEFVNYSINGTSYSFTSPADSFAQSADGAIIFMIAKSYNGPAIRDAISFNFNNTNIAAGSAQNLLNFQSNKINDSSNILSTIPVNITEYGSVGEFISGNFAGTVTGSSPARTPYIVTCSFRMRRYR